MAKHPNNDYRELSGLDDGRLGKELEALGFALAIYPTGPLYAATKAVKDYIAELKAAGTTMGRIDRMIPFEDFNQLIGLPEYVRLEERYRV